MIGKVLVGNIAEMSADALLVGMFEGSKKTTGVVSAIDKKLDGVINQLLTAGEFKAKSGEISTVHSFGKLPVRIIAVVGLGKRSDFNGEKIRNASAEGLKLLRKLNCRHIHIAPIGDGVSNITTARSLQLIMEGSLLGLYSFDKYKKTENSTEVEEIVVVIEKQDDKLEQAVKRGIVIAEATNLARDMVNEPSNVMTPGQMVKMAEKLAEQHGLKLTVYDEEDMRRMKMNAILGVARGSREPAKFIELQYRGSESSDCLGFVGKGITFDSGGISLKPSEGMGEMKDDMAGGAVAMAAVAGIARMGLKLNVTALVPATENLPGGNAFKPADILKSMNGKTIEIISTDAEGRLILADALCYALKKKLSPIIDLATLTGACRVALGTEYAGAFCNDSKLMTDMSSSAGHAGENIWQLPLAEEYKELIKSPIADIKNVGGRYAGAITAALFLAEFVDDTPWMHLDIAGVTSNNSEKGYRVKGASGFGVRTLIEMALLVAGRGE